MAKKISPKRAKTFLTYEFIGFSFHTEFILVMSSSKSSRTVLSAQSAEFTPLSMLSELSATASRINETQKLKKIRARPQIQVLSRSATDNSVLPRINTSSQLVNAGSFVPNSLMPVSVSVPQVSSFDKIVGTALGMPSRGRFSHRPQKTKVNSTVDEIQHTVREKQNSANHVAIDFFGGRRRGRGRGRGKGRGYVPKKEPKKFFKKN